MDFLSSKLVAIIGGTSVEVLASLEVTGKETEATRYGQVEVTLGRWRGQKETIVFLSRHREGHALPPHRINYRANIMALKQLGVTDIFATAAVGSLNPLMRPGELVLLDQFIDFTKSRPATFFDGEEGVVHIDMTTPYCGRLKAVLAQVAETSIRRTVHQSGIYVCTEGPRFETPAEIAMFRGWGGDVVGMTSVPEAVLAREADICYAAVATVTNYAAGIGDCLLTHQEVVRTMAESSADLMQIFDLAIRALPGNVPCFCRKATCELGQFQTR